MGIISDLRGRVFGRLTVPTTARAMVVNGHAYWPAVCECGNRGRYRGARLLAGQTTSCGCWRADSTVRRRARLQVSVRRRRTIAKMGARARWGNRERGRNH